MTHRTARRTFMRTINIRLVCSGQTPTPLVENLSDESILLTFNHFRSSCSPHQTQFCESAPELKACRPNQPAYLTLNRIDRLTGARLENTHLLLCKCPVGNILLQDTKNVKFYDFEQQSVQLMHQLCSPVGIDRNNLVLEKRVFVLIFKVLERTRSVDSTVLNAFSLPECIPTIPLGSFESFKFCQIFER